MLVSIGDRIHEGVYSVHSRFSRAVNFTCRGHLASIVTRDVGDGPLNIVIDGMDLANADGLTVYTDSIEIAGRSWAISSSIRYDSRITCPRPWSRQADTNLNSCLQYLARHAPPKSMGYLLTRGIAPECSGFERALLMHLRCGAEALADGRRAEGIEKLSGCGFGLTPSGDDFLAGTAVALHVEQQARGVDRTQELDELGRLFESDNLLSSAFVDMCVRGCVTRTVKEFVVRLLTGSPYSVRAQCDAVAAIGSTSGADFLAGLCMRLSTIRGRPERRHVTHSSEKVELKV